jgi:Flp pilus assembly protein TadD, contains TPR repeats
MTALVLVYLVLIAERSYALILSEDAIGIALGSLMLFLPAVAFWAIAMELRFGLRIEKLGKVLMEENTWPRFDFEYRPSGRPTKASAEAIFDEYRNNVEADEKNWRAWFALGLAYDAAGDRARARKSMREAIALANNPKTLES